MKLRSAFLLVAATAAGLTNASPSMADLIGTSVSGVMNISGDPTNFFDPANGFVPSGFGNSAPHGPNNVVIGSGTEFGFQDAIDSDTVNFTGTQVTLIDHSEQGSSPITFRFTNTALVGPP